MQVGLTDRTQHSTDTDLWPAQSESTLHAACHCLNACFLLLPLPLSSSLPDKHDACLENSVEGDLEVQWIGLVDQSILLCACGADEMLPMNPHLPADLFTCCLTNPIKTALRWYAVVVGLL